jgi:C-methyltransferase C-terminal domain/Putative zinc binding domain/Methyltransferase domain
MNTSSVTAINACRICGNANLVPILDLGIQVLTGVFPKERSAQVTRGPLQLVKCHGNDETEVCGLVQLAHSYDLGEMYGDNYGYRSGLNAGMVRHLAAKVADVCAAKSLQAGDVVIDIGSNDGTTLAQYKTPGLRRVGIDPTARKFADYYERDITVVADFFSAERYVELGLPLAQVVTSISMFYDLPAPMQFVTDVAAVLAEGGIWHCEQSYLPMMLDTTSYDTVCHEHLEYYAVRQMEWMTTRAGLRILDIQFNRVNGGSFAVTAQKAAGPHAPIVAELLISERTRGLETLAPYAAFAVNVAQHRTELSAVLRKLRDDGKRVFGLGASTKGNVVLQYCDIGPDLLTAIAEVNPDKFGAFTPGTEIPIVSEQDARAASPDVYMVLPWHFRTTFVEREAEFLARGGRLLFPLPNIEFVP